MKCNDIPYKTVVENKQFSKNMQILFFAIKYSVVKLRIT